MTPVCPTLVVKAMLFLSAGLNRWRQIIQLGYLQPLHTQRPSSPLRPRVGSLCPARPKADHIPPCPRSEP